MWAILAFSFINSLGTGVVTNGIFFLTDSPAYDFSRTRNYVLGVVLGVTYIPAALLAGPALRRMRTRFKGMTSRGVLAFLMVAMALLCVVPQGAIWMSAPGAAAPQWPIWVLVILYSPMTGVLWPMVEGYVSGGRSGADLRTTMGIWNVVWSAAIVLAYWGISPLIKGHAAGAICGLGGVHLLALGVLYSLGSEPAPHIAEHHEPHPPVYSKLLVTFQLLLPMSYVVSSALGPYLPGAMARLGVGEQWRTVLATAWLVPRVFTFLTLQRWQGWHGRWGMAVLGGTLLLVGFGVCVLSPAMASGDAAVALLLGGLFMFGTGMATIYSAALYYAMEVGQAEVHAAGMHEALIGLGYTIGPMLGLGASLAVDSRVLGPGAFEPVVLGVVAVIALGVAGVVVRRVVAHTRPAAE